ncbi:hypothetical protein B296_00004823 [Ensete ventricosum]|uniref:Uncharacterized protein n=1 Tax=Ensete ventricosum TaxID=4639 RepID=A0A426ZXU9_ENSVE|nr:hypothetical protein B296_00004823 [Ensete ventricosum]
MPHAPIGCPASLPTREGPTEALEGFATEGGSPHTKKKPKKGVQKVSKSSAAREAVARGAAKTSCGGDKTGARSLRERSQLGWSVRSMEDELLKMAYDVEALCSELQSTPAKAIVDYKESSNFKSGVQKIGHVSYEYEYRVAMAHF